MAIHNPSNTPQCPPSLPPPPPAPSSSSPLFPPPPPASSVSTGYRHTRAQYRTSLSGCVIAAVYPTSVPDIAHRGKIP
eukprot:1362774-Rhodomonas_salina.2